MRALVFVALGALLGVSAGARQQAPYRFRQVASGFELPVGITAPRSEPGRLYVVEKKGLVRVLANGKVLARPLLDLRTSVGSSGEEQGLLSLAFDPGYVRNGRLYVDFTGKRGNTWVLAYRARNLRIVEGSRRVVFFHLQPTQFHNGGALVFGPDGNLYTGTGDGGEDYDPENVAQKLSSPLGKLLRIDLKRQRRSVVGYGLRNPWRLSFDRATGDLYVGDVGQDTWEEVDYIPRRSVGRLQNFGWSVYEGRSKFNGGKPNPRGRLARPIVVYRHQPGHNCAVVGGYVYRGPAVPAARGRYFYGDYCSGRIWSLRVVRGRATGVRLERGTIPGLSSFGEDARGELYATSLTGKIYRLSR